MSKKEVDQRDTTSSDSSEEQYNLKLGKPYKGLEKSIAGTFFVDQEFQFKNIIMSVSKLINLSTCDEDLKINDFTRLLKYEEVTSDIKQVFKGRDIIKKELKGKDGRWFLVDLRPHTTEDDNKGVIITFVDVTQLNEAKKELAEKVEKIKELQRQIIKNDVGDRWRLGQYLHDNIGQSLVSAQLMLKSAKSKIESGEKDVVEDIDNALDMLHQSTKDVRRLSHRIVPVDIDEKGIIQAFSTFVQRQEKMYDIHCELISDDTVDYLDNIETATHLFRIAQEATKNAVVHGNAENVTITLKSDNNYLYLTIEDDGTGISDYEKEESGIGIHIMRHRVELLGGTFEILDTSDSEGKGVTISCKLPIEKL
ncbi:PAS domain-containing protein [Fodinibius roseus]|uniref:Oxygen sensor histidine kinase NreB n=1 Tax=Fodinibius roseus TaxID=1194090 RepID=A0A1M5L3D5_9BACT|nr:ATP-binding protein [Fodinibius roseus]SHG59450.1 PAS domain-containing protein [Fodinibius roseus]